MQLSFYSLHIEKEIHEPQGLIHGVYFIFKYAIY